MASIQAKRGQDRLRVIQKKRVIVLIRSNPTRKRKFQKNCKEMQKIKKHHYGFISSENGMGQAEIDTKKKKSYHSDPFQTDTEQGIPKK